MSGGEFEYRPDMAADDIPVTRYSPGELGVTAGPRVAEYTRVAASDYQLFNPSARLTLLVLFALRTFGEDQAGGWVALSRRQYARFGLADRHVRDRAVRAVAREGALEVRRRQGRTTLLRVSG